MSKVGPAEAKRDRPPGGSKHPLLLTLLALAAFAFLLLAVGGQTPRAASCLHLSQMTGAPVATTAPPCCAYRMQAPGPVVRGGKGRAAGGHPVSAPYLGTSDAPWKGPGPLRPTLPSPASTAGAPPTLGVKGTLLGTTSGMTGGAPGASDPLGPGEAEPAGGPPGTPRNSVAPGLALALASTFAALLLLLHARITRVNYLDCQRRRLLHSYVVAHPGSFYSQILRASGLANGALSYHLSILEDQGSLRSIRMAGRRLYFAAASPPPCIEDVLPRTQVAILEGLREHPTTTQSQLARRLGLRRQIVSYSLRRLLQRGVVRENTSEDGPRYIVVSEPLAFDWRWQNRGST